MSPARTITDEELLQLPNDGNTYEVVDGELVRLAGSDTTIAPSLVGTQPYVPSEVLRTGPGRPE